MLEIELSGNELWDETNECFVYSNGILQMEHSLVSLSKWEMKYCKPFLGNEQLTPEELLYYIKCMTLNKVDQSVYASLSTGDLEKIKQYLSSPMTATTFSSKTNSRGSGQFITSELIYSWMVLSGIPFEAESWPLPRLFVLIRILNEKPQKRSMKEEMAFRSRLNDERLASMRR